MKAKQKEIENEDDKAAKAEASKIKRQRELEKMRAKSIEMQEKASLITIHVMQSKNSLTYLVMFFWLSCARKRKRLIIVTPNQRKIRFFIQRKVC